MSESKILKLNTKAMNLLRVQEFQRSVQYLKKAESKLHQDISLEVIAVTYSNLGLYYKKVGVLSQSITYLKQAFEINKRLNNKWDITNNLLNISQVYQESKLLNKAIKYAEITLEHIENLDAQFQLSVLKYCASLYTEVHSYRKAWLQYKKALELSNQIKKGGNQQQKIKMLMQRLKDQQSNENALRKLRRIPDKTRAHTRIVHRSNLKVFPRIGQKTSQSVEFSSRSRILDYSNQFKSTKQNSPFSYYADLAPLYGKAQVSLRRSVEPKRKLNPISFRSKENSLLNIDM